ncbi:uncharacterized protein LOC121728543 isoform X2 [Aricia agestis]|uniref:uncharacterized protein LOC121728543 isoform X2 n=1 Tax=Aricia agestis TaxID=91739 RepID=UPI001C2081FE|nr:uncharacterized protein LOC121728543 isoform X2 [Aricia agestis]
MKLIVTLLLLSAAVVSFAAVAKAPAARANLSIGSIGPRDRLLHRSYPYREGRPYTIQYEDIVYRGNATTYITAVQATEIGGAYSTAWILAGGVGHSNVTVRVQSAAGYGYYYVVDVWGH